MRKLVIAGLTFSAVAGAAAWLWTPDLDRAELERVYAGPPSVFRSVAGLRLHVRDTGLRDGPAVLLLHGFGSSLHTWDAWATTLEPTHRVVRLDLPGAGLTGEDPTDDYSDARSIRVLASLLDTLGIARASVVGNSLGGRIAWYFALRHPERVDRLVLVSPDGFASTGFEYGKAPEIPGFVSLMRYVLPRPLVKASLAPAYADRTRLTDATVDRYEAMLLAPGVRTALLSRLRQSILQDPVPLLPQIAAPTLLVWGTQDSLIPFSNAAEYLRLLPNARLDSLPGVGHLPQEEAPERGLQQVLPFLAPPRADDDG